MRKIFFTLALVLLSAAASADGGLVVRHLANEQNIIELATPAKYLILPIQDSAPEGKIHVISGNTALNEREFNVRLARERVDYYVPLDLSPFGDHKLKLDVQGMPAPSICWSHIKTADSFEAAGEYWRPVYHHTPPYGWMNDPNGMFYKDGVWHLYYQYNPYGSTWGNMHWGHSTSTDLVNWKDEGIALSPDAWGTIFSGSCVVDSANTAGFGEGAVIAFYTSAKPTPWGDCQTQSIAYSLDNGKTFTKYEGNPVLTSDQRDFRDPKVFWYEPEKHWVMMLAVGQMMRIYVSENLKEWEFASSFGRTEGAHGGVWECPDLVELPVEGTSEKKWVLICNINPGGPFGGSAAQYFVGTFDGRKFTNESPAVTKWMDWGKDNYATVTWSGVNDRTVAIGWMSNWQYAGNVPTKQFRSANTLPRELSLYVDGGETYLKAVPVRETEVLRGECLQKGGFSVKGSDVALESLPLEGAYEIELEVRNPKNGMGFELYNSLGDRVLFTYDAVRGLITMDRTQAGKADFSADFPAVTSAPVGKVKSLRINLFVDKSSIEMFCNDGRAVMTNLVFPALQYDNLRFIASKGGCNVETLNIYKYE